MSAPKSYLPMFNGMMLGEALSGHDGVCCYPAIRHSDKEKFILKVISVPASAVQLEAMMLTGAFPNQEAALEYYHDLAKDMIRETEILRQLGHQEGFIPYMDAQIVPNDDLNGYGVYLLNNFRQSVADMFENESLTHRKIVQLCMDMCTALVACRRDGYIYVDLKPTNIFYSEAQGFQIGDLGFASIASLPYSSLPQKYKSRYSAPEQLAAMSVISDTADVYALGLILYQAYNGGWLPPRVAGQALPNPEYADYEFVEIIQKACHPDAAQRWKDPQALAQAVVSYIQRNGVSDECIIPVVEETPICVDEEVEAFLPDMDPAELDQEIRALRGTEYEELAFVGDLTAVHISGSMEHTDLQDVSVSDEISEILAQADDLIAHELPAPAVAPAPIEVPMPEPIAEEVIPICIEDEPLPAPVIEEEPAVEEVAKEGKEEIPPVIVEEKPTPKPLLRPHREFPWRIISVLTVIFMLASLLFGGFYFYRDYYLQHIDAMILETSGDMLSVKVNTAIDPSLLTVLCYDSYGNTQRQPLTGGVAIFSDLHPQTRYTVRVEISGFHKLTGTYLQSITTDPQTNITHFTATAGDSDGTVDIHFTLEGLECDNWILTYSSANTEPRQVYFKGHALQIRDLVIGEHYIFTLSREDGNPLIGETQVEYTVKKTILPKNVAITQCGNGSLTVQWEAPENENGVQWIVRCYNSAGYQQTITTSSLSATFTGLTHDVSCAVDVSAEGMTQHVTKTIPANPITVEDFLFSLTEDGMLQVTWKFSGKAPANGWYLEYTIHNTPCQGQMTDTNTAAVPLIPGAIYRFTVTANGDLVQFGGNGTYWNSAEDFSDYGISSADVIGRLCIRPDAENWTRDDVTPDALTDTFLPGQAAGLILQSGTDPETAEDMVRLYFVIHDIHGNYVDAVFMDVLWYQLWNDDCCTLDLPTLPAATEFYVLYVYIDGSLLTQLDFIIAERE